MTSIRRWLLTALLTGLTFSGGAAAYGVFYALRHEAAELFDYELHTVAVSLPTRSPAGGDREALPQDMGELSDDALLIQAWDERGVDAFSSGRPLYPISGEISLPRLPAGYHSIEHQGRHWRVFGVDERFADAPRFVQVAQPIEVRDRLAVRLALRSLWPILLWLPVTIILVLLIVRRGLRPLANLSAELSKRSMTALEPMSPDGELPLEVRPLVDALNALFDRLEKASAAQRIFIADAAHELRTPLTALKVEMQRALAEFASDPLADADADSDAGAARAMLHGLEARLNRIIRVAQQLLTMAREDAVRPASAFASVDLRAVAADVVGDLYGLAELRRIDLGLVAPDVDTGAYRLSGDAHGLNMLIMNLVDNAIRHTDPAGQVDVILERVDANTIALAVRDTGPGVPEAELPRIFDRFYRGRTTAAQGSGLGLAIVAHVAQRHGATLLARNRTDARGFEVRLTFPATA